MTSRPRSRNWQLLLRVNPTRYFCASSLLLSTSLWYFFIYVLVRVTLKKSARNSKRSIVEVKKLQVRVPHKIRRRRRRRRKKKKKKEKHKGIQKSEVANYLSRMNSLLPKLTRKVKRTGVLMQRSERALRAENDEFCG